MPPLMCQKVCGPGGMFDLLCSFYEKNGTSVVDAANDITLPMGELRVIAKKILVAIEELASVDRLVKFFLTWTTDVDEMLIWLKWLARGASSHPRFTEATWLVGAAEGGKDMMIALIQTLFGTGDDGLVATLSYQYITKQCGDWGNGEGCAPFLRSCAAARFIVISEVPNVHISMRTLKPLCEQRGALVAARTLYEGSHGFRPMALPIITSNFTPKLCHSEASDKGAKTRIRVSTTSKIWTLNPTLASHGLADVTLGDDANAGLLSPSLFFMLRHIYSLLDLSPDSRNVGPLPLRIAEETEACFVNEVTEVSLFDLWARTVRSSTPSAASTTGEVYAAALLAVGSGSAEATQLRSLLTGAGFFQDGTTRLKGKRYYVMKFPGSAVATAVKLGD